jgi:thiol-disulfide isomerase/thioredoxin
MKTPAFLSALPAVLSLLLGVTGCSHGKGAQDPSSVSGSGGSGHAEVGKPAPDLAIQTLNGKGKISLDSLQGKVAVIDFWATWCGPCRQSFPKLEELSKKMGDKVEIVGISVDDDQKGILDFVKETGVSFPIGWDEGHSLASRWQVGTMPTTFILDASGKVRFIHDGYHDGESTLMGKELAGLLDEPSDTKVAKNDKSDAAAKSTDASKPDASKSDAKSDTGKTSEALSDNSSSSSTSDDPPPPPPKKAAKKGGRGAGKKSPPKKKAAKKKPAPSDTAQAQ